MNRIILKAAVLSISLLLMSAPAVSPALANISAAFKDTNPNTIMLIVSMPSITMVLFSLVFGKLATVIQKRSILGIAAACFVLGGVVPAFLNDITSILVMRGIFGISMGFLMPLSTVLITDFFEGSERESMMGLQSAVINLGGVIFPILGGVLCAIDWHYTFYAYILGVIVFSFAFIYLPEPARIEVVSDNGKQIEKVSLPAKAWLLEVSLFVYNVGLMAFISNVAMKIVQEKLGDATSAGLAVALFTTGGLFTGLLFGKIAGILQKFTVAIGWLCSGIGFTLLASVRDFNTVLAGCILAGMGYAVTMPGTFVQLSMAVPPPAISFSFAVAYSAMGIGQFGAPMLFEFISTLFGKGPGSFAILVAGIGMIGVSLILMASSLGTQKANVELSQ